MKAISKLNLSSGKSSIPDSSDRETYHTFYKTTREQSSASKHTKSQSALLMTPERPSTSKQTPLTAPEKKFRLTNLTAESFDKFRQRLLDSKKELVDARLILDPSASEMIYEEGDQFPNQEFYRQYQIYKRNQHRFVVDQNKNLIYVKAEDKVHDLDYLATQKALKKLEEKYRGLKPEDVVKHIINKSEEPDAIPQYARDKQKVENIRIKSKALIDSKLDRLKSDMIAKEAKAEIDKVTVENAEIVERLIAEKYNF